MDPKKAGRHCLAGQGAGWLPPQRPAPYLRLAMCLPRSSQRRIIPLTCRSGFGAMAWGASRQLPSAQRFPSSLGPSLRRITAIGGRTIGKTSCPALADDVMFCRCWADGARATVEGRGRAQLIAVSCAPAGVPGRKPWPSAGSQGVYTPGSSTGWRGRASPAPRADRQKTAGCGRRRNGAGHVGERVH